MLLRVRRVDGVSAAENDCEEVPEVVKFTERVCEKLLRLYETDDEVVVVWELERN